MKSYVMWSRTTIWSALCPWPSRCDAQDVHAGVGQGGREAGLCAVVQGVQCQLPLWSARHARSTLQSTSRLLTLYMPMQDTQALSRILDLADKANGYVFARLADQSPVPPEMMYGATVKVSRGGQGAAIAFHWVACRMRSVQVHRWRAPQGRKTSTASSCLVVGAACAGQRDRHLDAVPRAVSGEHRGTGC